MKQSPATKVWQVKQVKQVWKATGKLFTTIGHQWRPTGRLLPLGDQWPLTRNTPPKVLPTKQWKPTGRLLPLGRQCPLVRSTALKSDCMPADPQETIAPVVQIVLWYLDSGCSKHMTGDRSRLRNFVKKFIGTVRFGNDHFGAIMGYGDYVIGDSVISRVYYVEGLGHNLFSVGQFCDSDLEVAFRKHTCFVRDLDGVDLIKGSRGTNLYTISVEDMMRSSPICLLSKASKNKSWLWHRRLNHLNFGTLNDLARKDLVRGLPRLKFEKDHLCSACQLGKSRKATHKPKTINTIMEVLHTLHMESVGITLEKTVLRTPQQNGVVERRNRTLVEAARTMLIFSKALLFLWAEAALCYPTNDSEDLGKLKAKADIGQTAPVHFSPGPAPILMTSVHISSGLALQRQNDASLFNNKMTSVHICSSLALQRHMASADNTSGPAAQRKESSGLVPQPPSPTPNILPTKNDRDSLFFPMFDEYFNPSPSVVQHVLVAVVQEPVVSTGTPSSTRIDQDTPSTSTSQTTQEEQSHVIPTSVEEDDHGIEVAHMDNDL
ncbi:retrovirus-related pol polyprotein from transposon TNT 1-94 [Tanacetum coccineum]